MPPAPPDPAVLFVPENDEPQYRAARHGGIRREEQVLELLARAGLAVGVAAAADFPAAGGPARAATAGAWAEFRRSGWLPVTPGRWRYAAAVGRRADYRAVLARFPAARVVVSENLRRHGRLVAAAKARGLRVVCAPHDVNALSAGRCRHDAPPGGLRPLHAEVAALGRADAVFAISREQHWLLRGFGVDSAFLPFYPPAGDRPGLAAVRARRAADPTRDAVLLLGTATHEPTFRGMADLLEALAGFREPGVRVRAVGFGTDRLAPLAAAAGCEVVGRVSDGGLADLLATARAVLVGQRFGCGALTRIPELLLAGVPVVANPIAARSFFGFPGVYVFDSPAELRELCRRPLPDPPPPAPPAAAEERFVATVRRLAGEGGGG